MSCMFLSVYFSSRASCAANGSFLTTLTRGVLVQECSSPDVSRTVTLKSSKTTGTPVTGCPDSGVTVSVICSAPGPAVAPPRPPRPPRPPARGLRNFPNKVGGSYFDPIPRNSPVTEWHTLQPPSPL